MGVLLFEPKRNIYQNIPCITKAADRAVEKRAESMLASLGPIFVKHSVWDKFGIILVHRHFSMAENEILVETGNKENSISVAIPWTVKNDAAAPSPGEEAVLSSHGLKGGKYVKPQSWCFAPGTNELVPYEYATTDSETPEVGPGKEFAAELFLALKTLSIEDVFGIRTIDNTNDQNSYETTPEGVRANVTSYGTYGPEQTNDNMMIKVGWKYNSEGYLRECSDRCGWCRRCNHCSDCVHNYCSKHKG